MLGFIRHVIKFFYKKLIITFFLIIYNKPKYNKKIKLKNFRSTKLKIKGKIYKIYEINNGRVYTDRNDITAYISEENYLTEGSLQFKKFDQINSKNQPIEKNITLINGTTGLKKKLMVIF